MRCFSLSHLSPVLPVLVSAAAAVMLPPKFPRPSHLLACRGMKFAEFCLSGCTCLSFFAQTASFMSLQVEISKCELLLDTPDDVALAEEDAEQEDGCSRG